MEDKRYYWIKLRTDFFNREQIDFLLSQKNGCEYVVLYQMLCLNTANTNGLLQTNIGEMIIPFNIEKIVRDTKYFDYDTVVVALELYKKLGLIYSGDDNILKIVGYEEMVGSESNSAKRVREWRNKKALQCNTDVTYIETQEIRDKSIEIRDKSKEELSKSKRFTPPTLEEVSSYCSERNNNVNPQKFIDFYQSKDWMVGKNKMKDWKACVRTWEQKETKEPRVVKEPTYSSENNMDIDEDILKKYL